MEPSQYQAVTWWIGHPAYSATRAPRPGPTPRQSLRSASERRRGRRCWREPGQTARSRRGTVRSPADDHSAPRIRWPAQSSPARCGMTRDESARSARAGRRHVWLRSRAPVRPPRCLAGARRARGPVPSRGAPRPRRILDAIERDSIPSTWRAGRLGTWESGLKLRTLSGCLRLSVQSQA